MDRYIYISLCWIFLLMPATASVDKITYTATFGVLGTIGSIENKIIKKSNKYEIHATVRFEGLAKVLMGGQMEYYTSKGMLKNGLMISNFYSMVSVKNDSKKVTEYVINHQKKKVIKTVQKWKNKKLIHETKKTLRFYAKDDLLTLYFNLGHAITKKGKKYHFKAVGLEKQQGKVQITVPNSKNESGYIQALGAGASLYAKARIHQKNFTNNQGDILLSLSKDSYIDKCVIKDILMFGDAHIIRMK